MTTPEYQSAPLEAQLQQLWQQQNVFAAQNFADKEPFYCLSMFPYPSGKLHMGHVRNYTIGDVIARYQRMQGKNVMQPMGWDAFGLPAENAAIANQIAPAKWTYQNISDMQTQLKRLGFAYDWSRELATCRPEYYRWEQWFFGKLYERGLVYKKMAAVNWDPIDQTVLANEQVIDGRGWRSGALVERREIPQWFIKITAYAEELLNDLDKLDGWPEQVKAMQRNWIGRSDGMQIQFPLAQKMADFEYIEVYTTRPDTLFGATYLAIAADHPIAQFAAQKDPSRAEAIGSCNSQSVSEAALATMEKVGAFTGLYAQHPLTGKDIPIWVANFVLLDYGSGAVMSVPAHDERDFEFAQKYQLPIVQVIAPEDGSAIDPNAAYTAHGVLINSGEYDGLNFDDAFAKIGKALANLNLGAPKTQYRLRDWGISRQRYWGTPIPMIYDENGNASAVPEHLLPVELPEDVVLDGVKSPLKTDPEWAKIHIDGRDYVRETDTFDTFMESSWYYARFCCPDYQDGMLDPARANYWLPVDQYIGGIEHAILHLLYARFFHKLLRDVGLVQSDEPFKRLLCQGMVLAESYFKKDADGRQTWYNATEVTPTLDDKGRTIGATLNATGEALEYGGTIKMSKSKNNGVDPKAMLDIYGADTVRLFMMSDVPPEMSLTWSEQGVQGAERFLNRLWNFVHQHSAPALQYRHSDASENAAKLYSLMHRTIGKVSDDIASRYAFNTALAANRELFNAIVKFSPANDNERALCHLALQNMVLMLSPIVPHICQALWQVLGNPGLIIDAPWPAVDEAALSLSTVELILQVNGKVRGKVSIAAGTSKADCEAIARAHENVSRFLLDVTVRKVIFVPNKLINIVAN